MKLNFDYDQEPLRDILFIDVKSFYATVECKMHGWDPLKDLVVVMSTADNAGNGLILASSPMAKKVLGITNVTRADNLPFHPELKKVPPRMSLYIKENIKLNDLFRQYVAEEDLLIYSIDESILDVTHSLNLFFPQKNLSRREKRERFARLIQQTAWQKLRLILSVGIGDNPLLAKLALDIESKHNDNFRAHWRYQDVPQKVWRIEKMRDFWGIGRRMERNFYRLGIDTIEQLAHTDPDLLRLHFGIMGEQHYHHANGIDRTILAASSPKIKEKSYGNSQVLPRNYVKQGEIEVVIKEMAEQVATRIRRHHCLTQCIHLYVGVAQGESKNGFAHQMKIDATDSTKKLANYCLQLFRQHYQGQVVRHVGITYSKLLFTQSRQLDLFEPPEKALAEAQLDQIIDKIREKYGFSAIVHATSKLDGARSLARSHLIGGHDGGAGGLDGL